MISLLLHKFIRCKSRCREIRQSLGDSVYQIDFVQDMIGEQKLKEVKLTANCRR